MFKLKMAVVGAALAAASLGAGSALAAGTPPSAEPNGCHGAATVAYKQLTNDPGAQGTAIGGKGNSDGDPANGQAHSAAGRGALVQAFLAANCGIGSEAP